MALDPSNPRPPPPLAEGSGASAVVAALSVYVEPLVADARVAVLGDGEVGLHASLLELGARTVHLYVTHADADRVARLVDEAPRGVSVRTLRDDFDVRDGAFDLVVIPDLGVLPDPAALVGRLRRVLDARGAVIAMGRARTGQADHAAFPELSPAVVEYAELYDLFALEFESVTMTGVLPFAGVVFAELGAGDDLAVSVDTRLVDPEPPGVFVVAAGRDSSSLDPYAIVQVERAFEAPSADAATDASREREITAAFAAMQLKAELLSAQLDEHRARLAAAEGRGQEHHLHFERLALERDAAMTRGAELEGILVAAQQALALLERRLLAAEEGLLERDDEIAALNAELDGRANEPDGLGAEGPGPGPEEDARLVERAERAEASLALHIADLAHVGEAHASETARIEEQLRERARVITAMEKELDRRELMVRELVASLEEARDVHASPLAGPQFESAPALPGVAPEEVARLRRKLDDLAFEVARRDGELVAQAWRIAELENESARLAARPVPAPPAVAPPREGNGGASDAAGDLARARDEVDALRQALTQEHAARVAAESGEELSRARAELARQSALLEQISGRGTHPEG
jgi:hypothetical protein